MASLTFSANKPEWVPDEGHALQIALGSPSKPAPTQWQDSAWGIPVKLSPPAQDGIAMYFRIVNSNESKDASIVFESIVAASSWIAGLTGSITVKVPFFNRDGRESGDISATFSTPGQLPKLAAEKETLLSFSFPTVHLSRDSFIRKPSYVRVKAVLSEPRESASTQFAEVRDRSPRKVSFWSSPMLHSIQGFRDIEWKEPVDLRAAPGDSSFKVVILRVLEERLALPCHLHGYACLIIPPSAMARKQPPMAIPLIGTASNLEVAFQYSDLQDPKRFEESQFAQKAALLAGLPFKMAPTDLKQQVEAEYAEHKAIAAFCSLFDDVHSRKQLKHLVKRLALASALEAAGSNLGLSPRSPGVAEEWKGADDLEEDPMDCFIPVDDFREGLDHWGAKHRAGMELGTQLPLWWIAETARWSSASKAMMAMLKTTRPSSPVKQSRTSAAGGQGAAPPLSDLDCDDGVDLLGIDVFGKPTDDVQAMMTGRGLFEALDRYKQLTPEVEFRLQLAAEVTLMNDASSGDAMEQLFSRLDADSSGFLDEMELADGLEAIDKGYLVPLINYKTIDEDGKGGISKEEFLRWSASLVRKFSNSAHLIQESAKSLLKIRATSNAKDVAQTKKLWQTLRTSALSKTQTPVGGMLKRAGKSFRDVVKKAGGKNYDPAFRLQFLKKVTFTSSTSFKCSSLSTGLEALDVLMDVLKAIARRVQRSEAGKGVNGLVQFVDPDFGPPPDKSDAAAFEIAKQYREWLCSTIGADAVPGRVDGAQSWNRLPSEGPEAADLPENDEHAAHSLTHNGSTVAGLNPNLVVWKQARDKKGGPARLWENGATSTDPKQGMLGDCWLISACSLIATRDDILVDVFPVSSPVGPPRHGIYALRFSKGSEWHFVIIDSRLPNFAHAVEGQNPLVYASCESGNEYWVPFLEKGYAKLHGCYSALIGGFVSDALSDFTGLPTHKYRLPHTLMPDLAKRKLAAEYGGLPIFPEAPSGGSKQPGSGSFSNQQDLQGYSKEDHRQAMNVLLSHLKRHHDEYGSLIGCSHRSGATGYRVEAVSEEEEALLPGMPEGEQLKKFRERTKALKNRSQGSSGNDSRQFTSYCRVTCLRRGTDEWFDLCDEAGIRDVERYTMTHIGHPDLGVLAQHAYGLVAIKDFNGMALVRVRNPHKGENVEWCGRWSDMDEYMAAWLPDIKQVFGKCAREYHGRSTIDAEAYSTDAEDGTFIMHWHDWTEIFTNLYVVVSVPRSWYSIDITAAWKGGEGLPKGDGSSWQTNPRFYLTVGQDAIDLHGVIDKSKLLGQGDEDDENEGGNQPQAGPPTGTAAQAASVGNILIEMSQFDPRLVHRANHMQQLLAISFHVLPAPSVEDQRKARSSGAGSFVPLPLPNLAEPIVGTFPPQPQLEYGQQNAVSLEMRLSAGDYVIVPSEFHGKPGTFTLAAYSELPISLRTQEQQDEFLRKQSLSGNKSQQPQKAQHPAAPSGGAVGSKAALGMAPEEPPAEDDLQYRIPPEESNVDKQQLLRSKALGAEKNARRRLEEVKREQRAAALQQRNKKWLAQRDENFLQLREKRLQDIQLSSLGARRSTSLASPVPGTPPSLSLHNNHRGGNSPSPLQQPRQPSKVSFPAQTPTDANPAGASTAMEALPDRFRAAAVRRDAAFRERRRRQAIESPAARRQRLQQSWNVLLRERDSHFTRRKQQYLASGNRPMQSRSPLASLASQPSAPQPLGTSMNTTSRETSEEFRALQQQILLLQQQLQTLIASKQEPPRSSQSNQEVQELKKALREAQRVNQQQAAELQNLRRSSRERPSERQRSQRSQQTSTQRREGSSKDDFLASSSATFGGSSTQRPPATAASSAPPRRGYASSSAGGGGGGGTPKFQTTLGQLLSLGPDSMCDANEESAWKKWQELQGRGRNSGSTQVSKYKPRAQPQAVGGTGQGSSETSYARGREGQEEGGRVSPRGRPTSSSSAGGVLHVLSMDVWDGIAPSSGSNQPEGFKYSAKLVCTPESSKSEALRLSCPRGSEPQKGSDVPREGRSAWSLASFQVPRGALVRVSPKAAEDANGKLLLQVSRVNERRGGDKEVVGLGVLPLSAALQDDVPRPHTLTLYTLQPGDGKDGDSMPSGNEGMVWAPSGCCRVNLDFDGSEGSQGVSSGGRKAAASSSSRRANGGSSSSSRRRAVRSSSGVGGSGGSSARPRQSASSSRPKDDFLASSSATFGGSSTQRPPATAASSAPPRRGYASSSAGGGGGGGTPKFQTTLGQLLSLGPDSMCDANEESAWKKWQELQGRGRNSGSTQVSKYKPRAQPQAVGGTGQGSSETSYARGREGQEEGGRVSPRGRPTSSSSAGGVLHVLSMDVWDGIAPSSGSNQPEGFKYSAKLVCTPESSKSEALRLSCPRGSEPQKGSDVPREGRSAWSLASFQVPRGALVRVSPKAAEDANGKLLLRVSRVNERRGGDKEVVGLGVLPLSAALQDDVPRPHTLTLYTLQPGDGKDGDSMPSGNEGMVWAPSGCCRVNLDFDGSEGSQGVSSGGRKAAASSSSRRANGGSSSSSRRRAVRSSSGVGGSGGSSARPRQFASSGPPDVGGPPVNRSRAQMESSDAASVHVSAPSSEPMSSNQKAFHLTVRRASDMGFQDTKALARVRWKVDTAPAFAISYSISAAGLRCSREFSMQDLEWLLQVYEAVYGTEPRDHSAGIYRGIARWLRDGGAMPPSHEITAWILQQCLIDATQSPPRLLLPDEIDTIESSGRTSASHLNVTRNLRHAAPPAAANSAFSASVAPPRAAMAQSQPPPRAPLAQSSPPRAIGNGNRFSSAATLAWTAESQPPAAPAARGGWSRPTPSAAAAASPPAPPASSTYHSHLQTLKAASSPTRGLSATGTSLASRPFEQDMDPYTLYQKEEALGSRLAGPVRDSRGTLPANWTRDKEAMQERFDRARELQRFGDWVEAQDRGSGKVFYFNQITGEGAETAEDIPDDDIRDMVLSLSEAAGGGAIRNAVPLDDEMRWKTAEALQSTAMGRSGFAADGDEDRKGYEDSVNRSSLVPQDSLRGRNGINLAVTGDALRSPSAPGANESLHSSASSFKPKSMKREEMQSLALSVFKRLHAAMQRLSANSPSFDIRAALMSSGSGSSGGKSKVRFVSPKHLMTALRGIGLDVDEKSIAAVTKVLAMSNPIPSEMRSKSIDISQLLYTFLDRQDVVARVAEAPGLTNPGQLHIPKELRSARFRAMLLRAKGLGKASRGRGTSDDVSRGIVTAALLDAGVTLQSWELETILDHLELMSMRSGLASSSSGPGKLSVADVVNYFTSSSPQWDNVEFGQRPT